MSISSRNELKKLFLIESDNMNLPVEVFSDGPVNAQIAIVGEGPGESEIRQRLPFVGGSGRFLWDEGRPYGITRHNVYVTNVVKRQISLSSQGNARHAVGRHELSQWIALVRWELAQLPNLRYVFLMGNYALEAFTENSGITHWRGSVLDGEIEGRKVKFVCAFNPAYVLREPKFEPIFKMDMHKLNRVVENRWNPYNIVSHINPGFKEACDFIRQMAHEGRPSLGSKRKPVALDIETPSRQVACIGLSNSPNEAMCINFRDENSNRFSLKEEVQLWRLLQSNIKLMSIVAQNGIFDSYYSWLKSRLFFNVSFDTMLAHHLLFPQLPHSLAFLVSQYTTHPFYKDEGKGWREGGNIDSFWTYNCKDAALTVAVYQALKRDLERQKLSEFFHSHIMRLQPHLVQATVHGVGCDVARKEEVRERLSEDVAKILESFNQQVIQITGDEDYYVNPNSPNQLGELLFTKLKLRGRGLSTDKTNRDRMLNDSRTPPSAREILTTIDKYKTEHKFLTTYAESEIDPDGRFRTVYKQHGVSKAPGRLSSAQTADNTGMNLQNQPQRAYEMFVADPNTVFIYLDGSQAEARIVGWYYEIEQWKEDFERARVDGSYDCHRALAAQMFKIPYERTPEKDYEKDGTKSKRYIAKRCRHGLNYRMQPNRLAEVTGLSFYEARKAFQIYHQITPELRRGWSRVEEQVRKNRELFNAYGRRWKVIQRLDPKVLESIIAFYPQSTMGDHVCRAWYMAEEDPKWPVGKARIAMNIHDALIGIAEPSVAKMALKIMQKHMEAPIPIISIYGRKSSLIIPAETKISKPDEKGIHRWSGLEPIKL